MVDKIGRINNPLTIIAIFAGLAEVASTTVLALLPISLQTIFIWFVMIFPSALVVIFFLVLIFKREVLYAPSDYKSDETFINMFTTKIEKSIEDYKASAEDANINSAEKERKIENTIKEIEDTLFDLKMTKKQKNEYFNSKLVNVYTDLLNKYSNNEFDLVDASKHMCTTRDGMYRGIKQLIDAGLIERTSNGKYKITVIPEIIR